MKDLIREALARADADNRTRSPPTARSSSSACRRPSV